jgi:hypothetical protein
LRWRFDGMGLAPCFGETRGGFSIGRYRFAWNYALGVILGLGRSALAL